MNCPGRKNGLRLACLKCNSKCHISALSDKAKTTSLYTSLEISQNSDETYILPVVQITFSNGARRMAINCIPDTGSQRSYFSSNNTYFLKSSKGQIKEVRLPLNTYTNRSTKNFQLVELKIGFGDGKETTRPVIVNKTFNIPYYLRSIEKNLKQRNSKFAFTFSRHNNEIKILGLIGVNLFEHLDNLKIIDCVRG